MLESLPANVSQDAAYHYSRELTRNAAQPSFSTDPQVEIKRQEFLGQVARKQPFMLRFFESLMAVIFIIVFLTIGLMGIWMIKNPGNGIGGIVGIWMVAASVWPWSTLREMTMPSTGAMMRQ